MLAGCSDIHVVDSGSCPTYELQPSAGSRCDHVGRHFGGRPHDQSVEFLVKLHVHDSDPNINTVFMPRIFLHINWWGKCPTKLSPPVVQNCPMPFQQWSNEVYEDALRIRRRLKVCVSESYQVYV